MANVVADKNGVSEAINLFKFIRELNSTRAAVKNISNHQWHLWMSNLPDDPEHIAVHYYGEDNVEDGVLISVRKPDFTPCPEPEDILRPWLKAGWDKAGRDAEVISSMPRDISAENNVGLFDLPEHSSFAMKGQDEQLSLWQSDRAQGIEKFEDNEWRVRAYEAWLPRREAWSAQWALNERVQRIFDNLYDRYNDLKRDAEASELIVANGIFRSAADREIEHPLLTHRVDLKYDASENVMRVLDTETATDFYAELFSEADGESVHKINELVQESDVHPLERGEDIERLLTTMVRTLSPKGIFSKGELPDGWEDTAPYLLTASPCLIFRARRSRIVQAVGEIIDDINENGVVPSPIRDIVVGGKRELGAIEAGEMSVEEVLAAVGGESAEILLSKEANKEQLEIARAIEHYDAVLVQGPPGTGKTHTIANLLGHFLAQGKSVLVTSYTGKALSVLKSKVAPGLQNLCVEVLGDTSDMEKSVNGIIAHMSSDSLAAIRRDMSRLKGARDVVISQLAEKRRRLFAMRHRECACLVYNGEDITPLEAAKFVCENRERLGFIPGEVRRGAPLPLGRAGLAELYATNGELSREEEEELKLPLPNPAALIPPEAFGETLGKINSVREEIEAIAEQKRWQLSYPADLSSIELAGDFGSIALENVDDKILATLAYSLKRLPPLKDWLCFAIADGKQGGYSKERWLRLIAVLEETEKLADKVAGEEFGRNIILKGGVAHEELKSAFENMRGIFEESGKISWLQRAFHSEYKAALAEVRLDGGEVSSASDCDLVLHRLELASLRKRCAGYWEALPIREVESFEALDERSPEHEAKKYIPFIEAALAFEEKVCQPAGAALNALGISLERLAHLEALDRDEEAARKKILAMREQVEPLCRVLSLKHDADACRESLANTRAALVASAEGGSGLGRLLYAALEDGDEEAYSEAYEILARTYAKAPLQRRREELLAELGATAPQWAAALRQREGIHGASALPENLEEAWKWKQLSLELDELTREPFETVQRESVWLGRRYREVTAEYAEKSAWYHLLKRTECDLDIRQALAGWKLNMKKVGKGTGKRASAFRKAARENMRKCQSAVPCWIMPIGRAMESLSPRGNKFDIVIIDEASQADLSALAILYLGKKLIVVGDDEQVSPMAVGIRADKATELAQKFIPDIPNASLYTQDTSVYDIVGTTFTPLMLKEHFRCVPEIIGFSNELSYHGVIKPLRAADTSALLPAVVPYRVRDGKRLDGKKNNPHNPQEARAIVALLKACLEQEEYAGKTFGLISLLGDEQVRVIQGELRREIAWRDIEERNIICGNSAHFQGDERDVIFLSMVDSGREDGGPLSLLAADSRPAIKKRYNVAASRARDQLWVVYSLDSSNDLKTGDLRKRLIDYALDPHAAIAEGEAIAQRADSPFEEKVAKALVARGYHIAQQWEVGAYRIDIVALYKNKKIAIECDGEKYHSGDEAIRKDMERQTILERLGWRFIRIRGSEYFRYPEETIERVTKELGELGIEPESAEVAIVDRGKDTELLSRVKRRALEILNGGESTRETKQAGGMLLFVALVRQIAINRFGSDKREAVWANFKKEFNQGITPETLDDISDETLARLELSKRKILCLKGLAKIVKNGVADIDSIAGLPADKAIEQLSCLSGVGVATAEKAWESYMSTR